MFKSATPAITQEQVDCIKFSTLDLGLDILAEFSNHVSRRRVFTNNESGRAVSGQVKDVTIIANVKHTSQLSSRLPDDLSEVRWDRVVGIVR